MWVLARKELMAGGEEITIKIGKSIYETKVIFAEMGDFSHGILGQKGFFDHFDVKLSYQKQLIEIEALSWKN